MSSPVIRIRGWVCVNFAANRIRANGNSPADKEIVVRAGSFALELAMQFIFPVQCRWVIRRITKSGIPLTTMPVPPTDRETYLHRLIKAGN